MGCKKKACNPKGNDAMQKQALPVDEEDEIKKARKVEEEEDDSEDMGEEAPEESEDEEDDEEEDDEPAPKKYSKSKIKKALDELEKIGDEDVLAGEEARELIKAFGEDNSYREMVDGTEFFKSFDEKHFEVQTNIEKRIDSLASAVSKITQTLSGMLKAYECLEERLEGFNKSFANVKDEVKRIGEEPVAPRSLQSSSMKKGFIPRGNNEQISLGDYVNKLWKIKQSGQQSLGGQSISNLIQSAELYKALPNEITAKIDEYQI